jgi:hypothetical protein
MIDIQRRLQTSYPDLWDAIEEHLLSKKNITLSQHYHIPQLRNTSLELRIKDDIKNQRFEISLLIIAWFNQGLTKYLGLQQNHINQEYNENMFDGSDLKFIHSLISSYGLKTAKQFKLNAQVFHNGRKTSVIKMGQKLIPLSKESHRNILDITHQPWLELHISKLVSDLVVNSICPGVAITHDWFVVYGITSETFSNPLLYTKTKQAAKQAAKVGSVNRSQLYESRTEMLDNDDQPRFNISDIGVVILSENVGRTVNDIAVYVKSKSYIKSVGNMFEDVTQFTSYMFSIIYTLYCLNSKLNTIQGDLHLNNTTIHHHNVRNMVDGKTDNGDSVILYSIGSDIFQLPDNGWTGTIIDYSRSFIIPADPHQASKLQPRQIERIMLYYKHLFPEVMAKHSKKLLAKLKSDFQVVFKVFTAIDAYTHTERLTTFMANNTQLRAHKNNIALVSKINTIALFYLKTVMVNVITKNLTMEGLLYPNRDILYRCFPSLITKPKKISKKINGIYFSDSELKYSIDDYDKFPPFLLSVKLKKGDEVIPAPFGNNAMLRKVKSYYQNRLIHAQSMALEASL